MSKPVCYSTKAFSTVSATAPLGAATIERRNPTASDVQILYCGVCHSDLHYARNEWGFTQYPAVPGHEIVGRVTAVGSGVKKFKVGETVGVGCLVDSCRSCPDCRSGLEQFCTGMVMTYGSTDKILNRPMLGGYAQSIVVTEDFVLRMPANLNPAAAAPLLCAGITTYSPLRHWKVGPGQKVGIVGLGGLGHMGVKFARAFGPTSCCSPRRRAKSRTENASAHTRWSSPRTRPRWRRRREVSISSWMPCPRATTSTPISTS